MTEPRKDIISKRIEILTYLKDEKIPQSAKKFVEKWIQELQMNPVFDTNEEDLYDPAGEGARLISE